MSLTWDPDMLRKVAESYRGFAASLEAIAARVDGIADGPNPYEHTSEVAMNTTVAVLAIRDAMEVVAEKTLEMSDDWSSLLPEVYR